MFTDFEYADKRLSDFGWIVGHIDSNSGVAEVDIGCDITFNTVKNNHSSIHYVSSTSYENVCTPPSFDIFKNPCGKNQEDMYVTNDEVGVLTKWLNRHGYRKFKPLYDSDDSDIHYYGSFNVKKKTINDRVVGLVLTFNSNAPYGFGEQITNGVDMDSNEMTASGEFIHVDDGAMGVQPKNIKLFGRSTQNTVPGNQLFDAKTAFASQIEKGLVTVNDDGSVTLNGTFNYNDWDTYITLPAGSYFFRELQSILHQFASGSDGLWNNTNAYVLTEETRFYCYIKKGTYENVTIYPMISTTYGAEFEPYVGGEASPNMKYPQSVESLGGSGSIVSKLLNGNLFKPNVYLTNCTYDGDGIYSIDSGQKVFCVNSLPDSTPAQEMHISNGDVTLSFEIVATNSFMIGNVFLCTCGSSVKNYGFNVNQTVANGTLKVTKNFTLVNDVEKMGLVIYGNTVEGLQIKNISLVLGSDEKPYKPYIEQPFTALTPTGLKGIPLGTTIPDTIKNSPIHMSGVYWDSVEGQYYIADTENENGKDVQRIARHYITSDDTVYLSSSSTDELKNFSINNVKVKTLGEGKQSLMMSNIASSGINQVFNVKNTVFCGTSTNDVPYICVGVEIASTVSEFKTVCVEKGAFIDYVLQEPIITDLTTEELTQFNALVMNYPNTNIVNDAGAYMEVTYLQDYDNQFTICGDSDEYTTLYPNITITCKRDGDLRITNTLTGNIFEVLNCLEGETIYINGEHKFIESDNENHKNTTLFNDFNYNFLDINVTEDDFSENIYETSIPCKIVINYSPIRKVGV